MVQVAVITGGSHGIGLETARLFAEKGYRVYELSRSGKDSQGITHLTVDLLDENSVQAAFSHIATEGQIDVLVNNAGFGISGAAEFTEIEEVQRIFELNFLGALRCIRQAIPLMRKRGGRIINISSVAAVFAIPFQSFYSASKAAINLFSLALANELRPFQIEVCILMPGDVKTDFTAARKKSDLGESFYGKAIETAVQTMERDEQNGMPPAKVAHAVYRAAVKRRCPVRVTVGLQYKIFIFLERLLPVRFANWIVKLMYS